MPYFAWWILAPLSWLPPELAWPVLVILSIGILLLTCRLIGVNPLWLLLSFPTLSMIWLGQIDALIVAGLVLALLVPSAWLRGVGLVLATIKPQIAGLATVVLLLHEKRNDIPKLLAAPMLVAMGSLWAFGPDWPWRWLANAAKVPAHAFEIGVVDPLPYLLTALLWVFRGRLSRLQAALFVATMASPYFGLYSYTVPLSFGIPWWGALLSYIWLLAYPLGNNALRLAWALPIALLVYQFIEERRKEAKQMEEDSPNFAV